MTFTIASTARDLLESTISTRLRLAKEADDRRTAAYEEAEAARTRGTPVDAAGYEKWRVAFQRELKEKRERQEEERVKSLGQKEREDWKKRKERLSGEFEWSGMGWLIPRKARSEGECA